MLGNALGQGIGGLKLSASYTIHPDKVRIAEVANSGGTIAF
jgi:hypothetical protein